MAPVTRSSGDTPALFQEQPDEDSEIEDDDDKSESSIQEFLQPLQETAERVSQQVEEFASRLHQFKIDRAFDDEALWADALELLGHYSTSTEKRLNETTSRNSRAFSHRKTLGDNDVQTQKLQLEADIWILANNLLLSQAPKAKLDAANAEATALSDLHRYSSNSDIWNAFLDSDTTAQRYESTLDWLYERAEKICPSIETIVSDLNTQSERGDGSWSAGPLFTKNSIKRQKRDRAWPLPLDPSDPGISATLRRQTDGQRTVTQLDPDAPSRQDAVLESQDEYHEQAAWQTCWELLRRGKSISDIRTWWEERNEQWRGLLLCSGGTSTENSVQSRFLRILNLATDSEWASYCETLCTSESITNPVQKAVYGVLCGVAQASDQNCKTIDEFLFSFFNTHLINRYYCYLEAYRTRLEDPTKRAYDALPEGGLDLRQFVPKMQANKTLNAELYEAHKLIQLALMGQDWEAFFVRVGRASAQVAYASGGSGFSHLMKKDESSPDDQVAQFTAQSEDSVRIVAHLQLVFQALGFLQRSQGQMLYQLENNIVNYIGWLEKEKKWSLLPIYASRLSPDRYQHVLGTILIKVTNEKEREAQVRLLKRYNIDVSDVIYGIASLSQFHIMTKFKSPNFRFNAPRFVERQGSGNSGQTRIRPHFMGDNPTEGEEKMIQAVEWYRFVEAKKWGSACHHISNLYYYWLCTGRLEAVHELRKRVGLGQISLAAFQVNLLYADESQDEPEQEDVQIVGNESQGVHPLARSETGRIGLYNQSLSWLHLEQLVDAMLHLEMWQELANEVEESRSDPTRLRTFKRELTKYLEDVVNVIEPLFDPEFLRHPNDETEDGILLMIRDHYLPECMLAYNSVLYFAGHAVSRTWLVECMDLAQRVAQNSNLTEAFKNGGRMRELMNAFALDSQALLYASEQGKNKGGKANKKVRGIDIWDVQWRNDGTEVDLDAID